MKTMILGAGLVGKAIALDLITEPEYEVVAVDIDETRLVELERAGIKTLRQDLSRPEVVKETVKGQELVVNALPGRLGFQGLKSSLEAGCEVVDIAFFPEDPFELDPLAQQNNLTAVVDCGVAPGLSNLLAAYGCRLLDRADSLQIYVGGLPVKRQWPFEYKAVFSPLDVIEEYLRPARFRENGRLVIKPALSDPEYLEFENLGTLEAFNTDGLRTLLKTMDLPDMKEKTLRYPGHREKMLILREAGFFSSEPVIIGNQVVKPVEVTARVLFSRLILEPGEEDLTVMRVVVSGWKDGKPRKITFELLDRFDRKTGIHSMARTTGYMATAVVRALTSGLVKRKGIVAPEFLVYEPEVFSFIRQTLEKRGIFITEKQDAA